MKKILRSPDKSRIREIAVICVMLLLVPAGCSNARVQEGEYLVNNVVDGDTIELANGSRVRYTGIDTPEVTVKKGGEWLYSPRPFAEEASQYNRKRVSGKKVFLEFDIVKKDKYGRLLAYVHQDGKMVNLQLVKQGLATVYTFPPNTEHIEKFMQAQKTAMKNARGIWSRVKEVPVDRVDEHIGDHAKITAKVSDIRISERKIFLYLNNGKKSLFGIIYAPNLSLFRDQGVDVFALKNDRIAITGKIEEKYGNIQVLIDNPTQLEIISR